MSFTAAIKGGLCPAPPSHLIIFLLHGHSLAVTHLPWCRSSSRNCITPATLTSHTPSHARR
ncbi:hypothetical protein E2C01_063231 [Portunus trituberculatus]|uniref:Uncharacterized protein n=1 Tax=Portunus trituberculatus TaxID=210409 RepID=A0A5B7HH12_PORTR|nr:hypothetical protein [Portunus trituberculatus]